MARLPDLSTLSKRATNVVVVLVIVAVVAVGVAFFVSRNSGEKTVRARFAAAVGIYEGTPVRILGVQVGSVTGVHPRPTYVEVDMAYDDQYRIPAQAGAYEVANSLVSDRYIQLSAYQGGPVMASGALIPLAHTGSPAELDDIYAALDKLSVALGPRGANKGGRSSGALTELLKVSAANLKGNGAALGNSITQLSKAASTLSDSRGNLFQTVQNLQKFTRTLKNSDTQVRQFNQLLARVAGELAAERADLGTALHELAITLDAVQKFIRDNAGRFHTDIKGLASVLGTVVKEKSSVNEALAVAPVALANLVHAYDPVPGVLGTRSNLASLTNVSLKATLEQVCGTLGQLTGGVLGVGGLGALGGNVQSVCSQLASSAPGGVPGGLPGGLPTGSGSLGSGSIGSGSIGSGSIGNGMLIGGS